MRDPSDQAKTAHLLKLPNSQALELVKADVLVESDWTHLLDDCDALVHCATVVKFAAKNPQCEIVDVAVKGTTHVLRAAARSTRTTRVVHLSSITAMSGYSAPADKVVTNADWCEDAT